MLSVVSRPYWYIEKLLREKLVESGGNSSCQATLCSRHQGPERFHFFPGTHSSVLNQGGLVLCLLFVLRQHGLLVFAE